MNIKSLIICAGVALVGVSCNGAPSGEALDKMGKTSAEDSLTYYVGLQAAYSYKMASQSDTTFATTEARKQFLAGMTKGMQLINESEAYNQGLQMGIQTALGIKEHASRYGMKLDDQVYLKALAYGIENPDSLHPSEINNYITAALSKAEKDRMEELKQAHDGKLQSIAKDMNLQMVETGFYYKIIKPGEGNVYSKGDKIEISFNSKELDGKEIMTPFSRMKELIVGVTQPDSPLERVIEKMRPGCEVEIYTNALSLYDKNYERFVGDNPGMIIVFNVKSGKVLESGLDYEQIRQNQEALIRRNGGN